MITRSLDGGEANLAETDDRRKTLLTRTSFTKEMAETVPSLVAENGMVSISLQEQSHVWLGKTTMVEWLVFPWRMKNLG